MAVRKKKETESEVWNILEQADVLREYLDKGGAESIRQLVMFMDSLKSTILALTAGDMEKAAESLKCLSAVAALDLFTGIGELTRDLHESIKEIKNFLEPIINGITEEDIQGLSGKLAHVAGLVKDTSERTLDLLFARQDIALSDNVAYDTIARLIVSGDKKEALLKLKHLKSHNSDLVNELMRISELQIHADLVDQIIKKVSKVVDTMEARLVELIRRYDRRHLFLKKKRGRRKTFTSGTELHGPVAPGDDWNMASSQDDVDKLLNSFGL